jgi:hypothetical protein
MSGAPFNAGFVAAHTLVLVPEQRSKILQLSAISPIQARRALRFRD